MENKITFLTQEDYLKKGGKTHISFICDNDDIESVKDFIKTEIDAGRVDACCLGEFNKLGFDSRMYECIMEYHSNNYKENKSREFLQSLISDELWVFDSTDLLPQVFIENGRLDERIQQLELPVRWFVKTEIDWKCFKYRITETNENNEIMFTYKFAELV